MTDATNVTIGKMPEALPAAAADVCGSSGHTGAFWGMMFLVFITFFVTVGPLIWPHDPTTLDIAARICALWACLRAKTAT